MKRRLDLEHLARLYHDPERAEELAKVLAENDEARELIDDWERQDTAMRLLYDPVAEEPVPEKLKDVLLRAADSQPPPRHRPLWQMAVAASLLLAVGGVVGWETAQISGGVVMGPNLAADALKAHETYVVEIRHPVEVAAADADHLRAWLNKRVGASFTPPILTDYGYDLLGGRIVPVEDGAAALLMYEDGAGQRLTVYITSEPSRPETAFRLAADGEVQSLWWIDDGLGCAVSGTETNEVLRAIGTTVYDQILESDT